ncbi:MAG TPA: SoxR reducing system RseC family protein [Methanosarcina sp.]|nr:SoxR reducing system RseC family protein [Methanosarcina sp.]
MKDNLNYIYSSDAGNSTQDISNLNIKKYFNNIFCEVSNLGIEDLLIYLLTVLCMMSGFLLFIYGLFMEQLYPFVMGFIFLISGFILDSTAEPDTFGK